MRRRKNKERVVRTRILIMCEGETEKNYFQAIKQDKDYKARLSALSPEVIKSKHPTPEKVVKEAMDRFKEEETKGNSFDEVWVVFDHDNHQYREKAYLEALEVDFKVAFSSIAFEVWYLLHFSKKAKPFLNAKQLEKELKKYYPKYEKARQNDFELLKDKLDIAFLNAKWLRGLPFEEEMKHTDRNPYTDVDVLVEKLISIKD